MIIRKEENKDIEAITKAAFADHPVSRLTEHFIAKDSGETLPVY